MYNATTMDHFLTPRHAGPLRGTGPCGRGEARNAACGDTAVIEVRVQGDRVVDAGFQSRGCAGAIASCSAVAEWLTGRAVAEVAALDAATVSACLDGLPAAKLGCAAMAAEAARKAVAAAPTA